MILTTLQSTTGTVIAGGATVSTLSVGGYPIVKDGDDFVVDTEWTWNINDTVSVKVPSEKIKMKLKGDIANIETNIMKCNEENAFTVKTIENDLTHYKNVNNIGVRNYNYKIEEVYH